MAHKIQHYVAIVDEQGRAISYAADSAAGATDSGIPAMFVFRPFGPQAGTATDGNWTPGAVDGDGALYVKVVGTIATSAVSSNGRPLSFYYDPDFNPTFPVPGDTEFQQRAGQYGALHVQLRDETTGDEVGVSAKPLRVDPTGTTTQPVSTVNGGNVALGSTTDALVAGDVNGTISGKLRGINALLNQVINFGGSVLQAQIMSAIPAGTNNLGYVRIDQKLSLNSNRYQITLILPGSISTGTNLAGLRKLNANRICRIKRIEVFILHSGDGLGNAISFWRASSVAGGSQITAADIPKKDTAMGTATLEVRTGAVTGTKANQPFWCAGSASVGTTNFGGPVFVWQSPDVSGDIVLKSDEGIIIDQSPLAADADDRYIVTIDWEEQV